MTDARFKMNDATREYYKNSLSLLEGDLFGAGGYDEIHIVNVKDFSRANLRRNDPDSIGIPFVDQSESIQQLRRSHPEYYAALKKTFKSQETSLGESMGLPPIFYSEKALALNVTGTDGQPDRKVGIVFMSDDPVNGMTGMRGYGNGFSSPAEKHLQQEESGNFDDYKKFIVLPHEVGHLVDMKRRGLYQLDTSAPLDSPEAAERSALIIKNLHQFEVFADEYAHGIFDKATQRGHTQNPMLMGTILNYRTINGVEHSMADGGIAQHTTTPFMKGEAFQGNQTEAYKQGVAAVNQGLGHSTAVLMGDYVRGVYDNDSTFWGHSIRDCFASAADDAYKERKVLAKTAPQVNGPDGVVTLPPSPGGISAAFQACMTGDFSNRYQLLIDQYGDAPANSPQGQLLDTYLSAAEAVAPDGEVERAHKTRPSILGEKMSP